MRRILGGKGIFPYRLTFYRIRTFCSDKPTIKNNSSSENGGSSSLSKYDEQYKALSNLDFMSAARILFSDPPKKKKFGLDFHVVQFFIACLPSLAVYLVAQYARSEMRKMDAELELKKQAEFEAQAKEMELKAAKEKAEAAANPEFLEVKERLNKLEETVKQIAEVTNKKSGDINELIQATQAAEPDKIEHRSEVDKTSKDRTNENKSGTAATMAHRLVRGLRGVAKSLLLEQQYKPLNFIFRNASRNYVSEMRKSAFEGNILRLIRNEIQYELDRSPPSELIPAFNAFKVDERRGEQWIRLSRKFGENEEIKVEVTMFDGSLPVKEDDETSEDMRLHITLIIDIFKGEDNEIVEFVCSAWPDSIEIQKVFTRGHDRKKGQPYMGPPFKELDDELQNSLYDFLEERGIDDELAEFLHRCMKNKDKTEYLYWMENLKSFIQTK
ncbi:hypothetical protein ACJIZ3_010226 [Penstemon smallii]|uniref:Uncharacterized protein n=1 Tax=Penstemon smallii TaxID=265156 RepID=A0ABD3TER3_9LAMI